MKRWGLLALLIALGLLSIAVFRSGTNVNDDDAVRENYKVGERLLMTPTVTVTTNAYSPYRKLNWDELMPKDWDPMKDLTELDLSEMQDSDPRAMEALEKVRAAWNDAPIVPELNGARIEIPGFVVPLDLASDRVKEFLLVPYFGACIHVPPPPSNQVLHILIPDAISEDQQKSLENAALTFGAVSVSGILETVSINTSMGFSSYRLNADRIDPYKPPETSVPE